MPFPPPQFPASEPDFARQIENIKESALWYKIRALIYDLRHFTVNPDSLKRLIPITDPLYIGLPYFNGEEAQVVKHIFTNEGTQVLEDVIQEALRKNNEQEGHGCVQCRVCAAAAVVPVIERCFGVEGRRWWDATFVGNLRERGLEFMSHVFLERKKRGIRLLNDGRVIKLAEEREKKLLEIAALESSKRSRSTNVVRD